MKHLEVVAAIIEFDSKILCMQRKENKLDYISKKYEFPGGKVELNETFEQALTRELKEEMEIDVKINKDDFFMTTNHTYLDFSITLNAYKVYTKSDKFVMNDHIAFKWLKKEELLSLDWAAADIPIVKKLLEN